MASDPIIIIIHAYDVFYQARGCFLRVPRRMSPPEAPCAHILRSPLYPSQDLLIFLLSNFLHVERWNDPSYF